MTNSELERESINLNDWDRPSRKPTKHNLSGRNREIRTFPKSAYLTNQRLSGEIRDSGVGGRNHCPQRLNPAEDLQLEGLTLR